MANANVGIKVTRSRGRHYPVQEETMTERVETDLEGGRVEVGTSIGHTIGLPGFSSFRVDVSIKLPTAIRSIDKAAEFAEEWCKERCAEIIDAEGISR